MMKNKIRPTLALFSLNNDAVSETFVRAHRDKINAEVDFYSTGELPTLINGDSISRFKYQLRYFFAKKFSRTNGLSLDEYCLKQTLKNNSPDAVLCEYGVTANASLRVISQLDLPLIVYFHGYDISVKWILENNDNYKNLIRYASKYFVVSKDMKLKLVGLGAKQSQIIYNPCAPNDEYFEVVQDWKKKKKVFIAAGRFVNKKAPHLTLLAFKDVLKKHPDAQLIMAGHGELHQVCRNLASYMGIERNVVFPGTYGINDMKNWLSKSIAFVQHSVTADNGDQEGTPVAILEAMAAGLPVIATKHAGIKDIVTPGVSGFLVDEYDIEGMSKAMINTLEDISNSKTMGEAGKKFVQNSLTMDMHISKIDKVIAECLETSSQLGLTGNKG